MGCHWSNDWVVHLACPVRGAQSGHPSGTPSHVLWVVHLACALLSAERPSFVHCIVELRALRQSMMQEPDGVHGPCSVELWHALSGGIDSDFPTDCVSSLVDGNSVHGSACTSTENYNACKRNNSLYWTVVIHSHFQKQTEQKHRRGEESTEQTPCQVHRFSWAQSSYCIALRS
jgi:hypothetical protein